MRVRDENKQKVAMTDLPPAVQKTIEDNLAGGAVTETIKETKDGKTYYEAQVQKSGGEKVEIKVVDHKTGGITKAEKITDADDLKNAKEQSQTMAKAKVSLKKAVEAATKANSGYRALSATPTLDAEKPVANITLMKGEDVKNVTEKLD